VKIACAKRSVMILHLSIPFIGFAKVCLQDLRRVLRLSIPFVGFLVLSQNAALAISRGYFQFHLLDSSRTDLNIP